MSSTDDRAPHGSGFFAAICGGVFLLSAIAILVAYHFERSVPRIYILVGWLTASGLIAITWGVMRIKLPRESDRKVGMETINMIVSMLAVTFAVAALVTDR